MDAIPMLEIPVASIFISSWCGHKSIQAGLDGQSCWKYPQC